MIQVRVCTVVFSKDSDAEEFRTLSGDHSVLSVLNKEAVDPGDVFYLPAGRVHSIGRGILLAEIQQSSDITYRVYDFDRTDDSGQKRDLHITDAIEVMDFGVKETYKTEYERQTNDTTNLVESPYFVTNLIHCENQSLKKGLRSKRYVYNIYVSQRGSQVDL